MGAAAYNRGSRAIRAALDRELATRPPDPRAPCAGRIERGACTACRHAPRRRPRAGAPCPCTHPLPPDPCAGGPHPVTAASLDADRCARCGRSLDALTLEP